VKLADTDCAPDDLNGREDRLRDTIFSRLHSHFLTKTQIDDDPLGKRLQFSLFERWFVLEKEIGLPYSVGTDGSLSHKSDLLLSVMNKNMHFAPVMNVEIKFRSCVSDAFKARAYDQIHLKRSYPLMTGLLIFIKPRRGGISAKQARMIGYPFDLFFTAKEEELADREVWGKLCVIFEERMRFVAQDPTVEAPFIRAES
jgi:hypothetical protein